MGHGELLILDMRSSAPNNGAFQADGDSVIEPKIGAGVASHVESVFFLNQTCLFGANGSWERTSAGSWNDSDHFIENWRS